MDLILHKDDQGEELIMGVVEAYIIPILYAIIGIAVIGFCSFGFYRLMRTVLPKELNSWLKFKILRKDFPEVDVVWCDAAHESGADAIDVGRSLRLNGVSNDRIEDLVYIFKELTKLKGGLKNNDRQIKSSSLKTFVRESKKD